MTHISFVKSIVQCAISTKTYQSSHDDNLLIFKRLSNCKDIPIFYRLKQYSGDGGKRIIARGVAQNVKQVCPTFSPYRKFGIPSISPSRSRFSLFSCFLFHFFFFFFALKANSTLVAKGARRETKCKVLITKT